MKLAPVTPKKLKPKQFFKNSTEAEEINPQLELDLTQEASLHFVLI